MYDFAVQTDVGWPREITGLHFVKLIGQDPTTGLSFFFNEVFISRGWWVFALLTVSTKAIRAALANPVKSLRYE